MTVPVTVPDQNTGPTVVLAVESPTVQRVLGSVLGRAGYRVTAVGDGVAAARAARTGSVDAVVAWASLPRLSGFALSRLLREEPRTATLPIVLMTAPGQAAERYWATRCGADRAFPTDVVGHELVDELAAVLAAVPADPGADPTDAPAEIDAPDETDAVVLTHATEVLETALFETALFAEVTGLATAGLSAEGVMAGLLATIARAADPAFVAVLTPSPPLALVLVNQPASRTHYRELLLRLAADAAGVLGHSIDAAKIDARAADPERLLGADEGAHLQHYQGFPLLGVDGAYVGHLAISASGAGFRQRVLRTVSLLAEPAGRLVGTVTGVTPRA